MDQTHHAIDYIELNVVDLAASRAFYERAFGWEFNDYGPDYAGIRHPPARARSVGWGSARPARGGALVLLYSDDLDASVVAVEAAGGSVVQAPYDFPGGRRFIFTDNSRQSISECGAGP